MNRIGTTCLSQAENLDTPSYSDLLIELRGYHTDVHKIRSDFNAAITNPDEGAVYWLELRIKGGDVALHCAPLARRPVAGPAPLLREENSRC